MSTVYVCAELGLTFWQFCVNDSVIHKQTCEQKLEISNTALHKPCVKSPSGEAREHICHWCRPGRDHNTENKNAHVSTYFRLTSPPAYSVVRTVLGDKKSRFLRFLALLSLNQSFSRSRLISASCSASLRNAPLNALTVDTMLNGTASSMIRLSMLTLLLVPGLKRCYWDWL